MPSESSLETPRGNDTARNVMKIPSQTDANTQGEEDGTAQVKFESESSAKGKSTSSYEQFIKSSKGLSQNSPSNRK